LNSVLLAQVLVYFMMVSLRGIHACLAVNQTAAKYAQIVKMLNFIILSQLLKIEPVIDKKVLLKGHFFLFKIGLYFVLIYLKCLASYSMIKFNVL